MQDIEQILGNHLSPLKPIETGVDGESLSVSNQFDVVLFDIYGTLLISGTGDVGAAGEADNRLALKESIESVTGKTFEIETDLITDFIRRHHIHEKSNGIDYPEVDILAVWEGINNRLNLRLEWDQLKRIAIDYECRLNPVWPMPGLNTLFNRLSRTDLFLGIVSNAQFYTPIIMEYLLGETLSEAGFNPDLITYSYTLGEAKPSERMFSQAMTFAKSNHIPPERMLYIGNDMLKDVYTASKAGIKTALFAGDQRSLRLREDDERCLNLKPDYVITNLDQLCM